MSLISKLNTNIDIIYRYVISKLPYIDSSRLSVLGTNYGATLAGMVMGQTKLDICGVLTSPVVNWRHHGGDRQKFFS